MRIFSILFFVHFVNGQFGSIPFFYAVGNPFSKVVSQDDMLRRSGLLQYVYLQEHETIPAATFGRFLNDIQSPDAINHGRRGEFSPLFVAPSQDIGFFFDEKSTSLDYDDDLQGFRHIDDRKNAVQNLFVPINRKGGISQNKDEKENFLDYDDSDSDHGLEVFLSRISPETTTAMEYPSTNAYETTTTPTYEEPYVAFSSTPRPSRKEEASRRSRKEVWQDSGSVLSFGNQNLQFKRRTVKQPASGCHDTEHGYYPDASGDCRKYFVCEPYAYTDPLGGRRGRKWDFQCGPGTVFSTRLTACVHDTGSCPT